MQFHEVELMLEHPAFALLRSSNASMILSFLHRAFKRQHRVAVQEGELRSILEVFLEELNENEKQSFPMGAAQYLSTRCDDSRGFLRKYYGDDPSEALFELTAAAEKALLWLEQLRPTAFVGTESRLESIFEGLDDLLRNSSADPAEGIASLEAEMARIQEQIDTIRITNTVPTYSPVQINERYARLLSVARELLGDFRAVEENFKLIAKEIAQKHSTSSFSKGAILGHMLDADTALRKSEQGQSFYAFWELLLQEDRRKQFDEALQNVLKLDPLHPELKQNSHLTKMIPNLLLEGEKVRESHTRMAANLRRVLDRSSVNDRINVLGIIEEIHRLAI